MRETGNIRFMLNGLGRYMNAFGHDGAQRARHIRRIALCIGAAECLRNAEPLDEQLLRSARERRKMQPTEWLGVKRALGGQRSQAHGMPCTQFVALHISATRRPAWANQQNTIPNDRANGRAKGKTHRRWAKKARARCASRSRAEKQRRRK